MLAAVLALVEAPKDEQKHEADDTLDRRAASLMTTPP